RILVRTQAAVPRKDSAASPAKASLSPDEAPVGRKERAAMKITHVDTMLVQNEFHAINVPHMHRGAADWSVVEICRVATDTGVGGFGETIIHYTWSRVTEGAKKRVIGRDPFEEMWDDSLGAGLQMALFDAAGKA